MFIGNIFTGTYESYAGLWTLDTMGNETKFSNDLDQVYHIDFDEDGDFYGEMFVTAKADTDDESFSVWRVDTLGNAVEFATTDIPNPHGLTFVNGGVKLYRLAEQ